MKTAICHYSLHRTYTAQKWDLLKLSRYVKDQGADAIDFHVRFLGAPEGVPAQVAAALADTGLALSGLSLSTNFNQQDPAEFRSQIDTAITWIEIAGRIGAPASRVFGGTVRNRQDAAERKAALGKVVEALKELEPVARENGVVLALENHGGLPCTGAEQAEVLAAVNSPFCRATVDLGNYLQCPEDAVEGVKAALSTCAYVHVKDFTRKPDGTLGRCTVGEGDVDIRGCLKLIADSGYDGFVALEYEGEEDELSGVPKSMAFLKEVLSEFLGASS